MQLRSLTIKNFRCFGPVPTTIVFDRFTTLIGANSTGKTTILHALRKLLSPIPADRVVERSDFHVPQGAPASSAQTSMFIEARFDVPELLGRDDALQVAEQTVPMFFRHLRIDDPQDVPHVQIKLVADMVLGEGSEADIEQSVSFVPPPGTGPSGHLDARYRRNIHFIYVPALRDPTSQLKHHAGTLKWRLMRAVAWSQELRQNVKDAARATKQAFDNESGYRTVISALRENWAAFHDDDRYRDVDFQVLEDDLDAVLVKSDLIFRPSPDGFFRDAGSIGDGLRSLAYFTLVCALLKVELQSGDKAKRATAGLSDDYLPPALTIVAAEEPENHLAPHLLGRALRKLISVSEQPNSQIVISSHTAGILKRVGPESIRYLRLSDDASTEVKPIPLPTSTRGNVHKFVREAVQAHPELYFAKLVILGEGESEEVVLTKLLEVAKRPVDMAQISIVPLGGRHVNHMWRLLRGIGIPYLTLLDLDQGRSGGGWGRVRYAVKQLYFLEHPEKRDEDAAAATIEVVVRGKHVLITKKELDAYSQSDKVVKPAALRACISKLQLEHRVFFSAPLDLDFMMLSAFPAYYKGSFPEGRGPQLPTDPTKRKRRLNAIKRNVLKAAGSSVGYTDEQVDLFIHYEYLFLGRGKPVTHMIALSEIPEVELRRDLPKPLSDLISAVNDILGGSPEYD